MLWPTTLWRGTFGFLLFVTIVAIPRSAGAENGRDAQPQRPGWLGMAVSYHHTESSEKSVGWFLVEQLAPTGPAQKAGVRSGDLLVSIDGKPVQARTDLEALLLLATMTPGKSVEFSVSRAGSKIKLSVTPGKMTDEQFSAWLRNFELAKGDENRTPPTGKDNSSRH